jgi:type I restriction enzyme S subunit
VIDGQCVLLSIAGTIGLVNLGINCAIGRSVAAIKPNLQRILTNYLFYYLQLMSRNLKGRGSAQKIIVREDIENMKILLPPKTEQQKIVKILSVVDLAIAKTDEVIAKTERLKKGLMQELLTNGIGHKEYKYSKELGHQIPKEWKVDKVGEVCRCIVPGRNKPKRFDGNIPWITLPDIDGTFIGSSKTGLKVSKEEIRRCGGKIVPSGSVIMSCIGKFGIVAITTTDVVINQQLHAFICPEDLDPYFLAISLMSQAKYMSSIAATTVVPYMNKEKCNSIPIPIPHFDEQQKISNILSTIDRKLELEKKEKTKFGRVKQSLMELLITGKIRIKVD